MGAPKIDRSRRTVHVPLSVLDGLDRDGNWLFTNAAGNPVRIYGFRENVWYPTVTKAQAKGLKKKPRVHDLRHNARRGWCNPAFPCRKCNRRLGMSPSRQPSTGTGT
jgi:hypothetical protein